MNDKKRGIGSKQAEKLARDHFGPNAYVARMGRRFIVCTEMKRIFGYTTGNIRGTGVSWEKALIAAGITIPVQPVEVGE
jgi:hypothetical protein